MIVAISSASNRLKSILEAEQQFFQDALQLLERNWVMEKRPTRGMLYINYGFQCGRHCGLIR